MNKFDYILFFLMAVLLGSAVYFMIQAKNDNYACLQDPLRYAVETLEQQAQADVQCSCTDGEAIVYFTSEGITEIKVIP